MQKPDANGYVNIIWPSRTIPHGGIFHTKVAEPSTDRQAFLKVLIEESKLDSELRKKSGYRLRQPEEVVEQPERIERPLIRPRTSKRRSLSCIRESGVFEIEPYRPLKRGEDRQKLIDKLAHTMEYGDSPEQLMPVAPKVQKKPPELPSKKEQWNDLVTQIRERAEWLADMEMLGEADKHRDIIKDQIAERLRAMDALGVDSQCSSARSGFSTLRSREPSPGMRPGIPNSTNVKSPSAKSNCSGRSQGSAGKRISATKEDSARSKVSQQSKGNQDAKSIQSSGRSSVMRKIISNKEENVSAYGNFTPLQHSPRRKV